ADSSTVAAGTKADVDNLKGFRGELGRAECNGSRGGVGRLIRYPKACTIHEVSHFMIPFCTARPHFDPAVEEYRRPHRSVTGQRGLALALATFNAEEPGRSALRKASWRVLPLLGLGYALAYIDRVNVSFASLQMNDELHFSAAVYGLG